MFCDNLDALGNLPFVTSPNGAICTLDAATSLTIIRISHAIKSNRWPTFFHVEDYGAKMSTIVGHGLRERRSCWAPVFLAGGEEDIAARGAEEGEAERAAEGTAEESAKR